jgi:hypothetical protein
MNDQQKQAIREDAERAAREGRTPNERCPHPFSSEQGKWWGECYWRKRGYWDENIPDEWEGSERRAG